MIYSLRFMPVKFTSEIAFWYYGLLILLEFDSKKYDWVWFFLFSKKKFHEDYQPEFIAESLYVSYFIYSDVPKTVLYYRYRSYSFQLCIGIANR